MQTLAHIQQTHQLTCGLDQSEAEYSSTDEHGPRVAFDRDLCRAVAVAILGRDARIVIKAYPDDQTAMKALQSGEVDLIPTLSDDLTHQAADIRLSRTILHDGVALLVRKAGPLTRKKVCYLAETEAETAVTQWFRTHQVPIVPFPFQEEGEMEAAFLSRNCDVLAADATRLVTARAEFGVPASGFVILPQVLSNDALAAASREDDKAFALIVTWTFEALLEGEAQGITAANADIRLQNDRSAARLLGLTHEPARLLGLRDSWVADVLAVTGNYAEIYRRDLGEASPLNWPRGQNRLVRGGGQDGGLMQPRSLK